MTIVEALKELVLAYGGSASDGETVVDVLKDVTTAMGGSDTAGDTISDLIADITATVESGGGGGSSDFSYATVTVTNTAEQGNFAYLNVPCIVDGAINMASDSIDGGETGTVQAILYKGEQIGTIDCEEITSITGDITADVYTLTITGDGTITCVGANIK